MPTGRRRGRQEPGWLAGPRRRERQKRMLQRRFRRYGVADFITAEVEHGPSVRNRDVHPKEDHGPSQSRSKRGQLSALLQAHERREQLDNDDACQRGEHEHEHSRRWAWAAPRRPASRRGVSSAARLRVHRVTCLDPCTTPCMVNWPSATPAAPIQTSRAPHRSRVGGQPNDSERSARSPKPQTP